MFKTIQSKPSSKPSLLIAEQAIIIHFQSLMFSRFSFSIIKSGSAACIKSYLLAKINIGTFESSGCSNNPFNSSPASYILSVSAESIT